MPIHIRETGAGRAPDVPGVPAILQVALLALWSLGGCQSPSAAEAPDILTSLRFSPSAFDSFTRNTEIRYSLKAPVTVTVAIVRPGPSGGGQLVRMLFAGLTESKGSHAHTWLGDTEEGRFAPAGEYRGIVCVGGQRFETTVRVFHF